jgi:hypothetical protein
MSGFSFTPIISFICSFFILSILDFLADLLSTSISVDKILYLPYFCSKTQTIYKKAQEQCGPGSSVGTATGYGLDGPGIESQ